MVLSSHGFEVRSSDFDGWDFTAMSYRQLLPKIRQVSPQQVIDDALAGDTFWVIPDGDVISDVALHTGEWKIEDEPFPPGTMVRYNNQCTSEDDYCYGMVLKRITVNGWYIVLNDEGRHDLTGNVMMEVVSETTLG